MWGWALFCYCLLSSTSTSVSWAFAFADLVQDEVRAAFKSDNTEIYPWAGRDTTYGHSSSYVAPSDFSRGPTWTWSNPNDEQIRHSPLIDNEKNIYVVSEWYIHKFSSSGTHLWTRPTNGQMTASAALDNGALWAVLHMPKHIELLKVDMASGEILFRKHIARQQGMDTSAVVVHNGTIVLQVETEPTLGAWGLHAVKSSDGSFLWEYTPDDIVWNMSPAAMKDGSFMLAAGCGQVYRVLDGKEVWKAAPPSAPPKGSFCGTGGGTLGPNDVFYNVWNDLSYWTGTLEDGILESLETLPVAHVTARRVSDGQHLWTRDFPAETWEYQPAGNQYPGVGMIGEKLAVVAPLGPNPGYQYDPRPLKKGMSNAVVAMDAQTGEIMWSYHERLWYSLMCAGDENIPIRQARSWLNYKQASICGPDAQGIPLIGGDGVVYMSSGHTGYLYAIKDKNNDGVIDESEVNSLDMHNAFLNSPSMAQDMLVVASCWGPVDVFIADIDKLEVWM